MKIKAPKTTVIIAFILIISFPMLFLKRELWIISIFMSPLSYFFAGQRLFDVEIFADRKVIVITNDWFFWYYKEFNFSTIKYIEINSVSWGYGSSYIKIYLYKYTFWKPYHYYNMHYKTKEFIKLIQYLEQLGVQVENKIDFSTMK